MEMLDLFSLKHFSSHWLILISFISRLIVLVQIFKSMRRYQKNRNNSWSFDKIRNNQIQNIFILSLSRHLLLLQRHMRYFIRILREALFVQFLNALLILFGSVIGIIRCSDQFPCIIR